MCIHIHTYMHMARWPTVTARPSRAARAPPHHTTTDTNTTTNTNTNTDTNTNNGTNTNNDNTHNNNNHHNTNISINNNINNNDNTTNCSTNNDTRPLPRETAPAARRDFRGGPGAPPEGKRLLCSSRNHKPKPCPSSKQSKHVRRLIRRTGLDERRMQHII